MKLVNSPKQTTGYSNYDELVYNKINIYCFGLCVSISTGVSISIEYFEQDSHMYHRI